MDNKITRREKENKPKGYQVLETSIVTDNNKAIHNDDRVSIKGRKIIGKELFTTDDSRSKNSTIESDSTISKKHISQNTSQDLHLSIETKGIDFPIADTPCELQTHEYVNFTGNVQSNKLFDKRGDTTNSTTTSSNKIIGKYQLYKL